MNWEVFVFLSKVVYFLKNIKIFLTGVSEPKIFNFKILYAREPSELIYKKQCYAISITEVAEVSKFK